MDKNEIVKLLEEFFKNEKILGYKKTFKGKDAILFEKTLEIQELICSKLGLPVTLEVINILNEFKTNLNKEEAFAKIVKYASNHLSQNPKSNLEILKDAILFKRPVFSILPELKIITHTYSIFVFEKILLEEKDSAENVMIEFNKIQEICENSDLLSTIAIIADSKIAPNKHKLYKTLDNCGLKYIQAFWDSIKIKLR